LIAKLTESPAATASAPVTPLAWTGARRWLNVPRPRTHHIHMVETTSEFWRRQLLFRDYLRAHPEDAGAYETLKRHLASRFEVGRHYAAAKSVFIKTILDKVDRASTLTKNS
jgi:GrpB-like predicted nucleotidyltransferase (UPF0157 family)